MKRSAAVLGVSAIALSVVAIPVGAAVMSDGSAPSVAGQGSSESITTLDQADNRSDTALAGTGAAFLLLGIGTVSVAHRRRWRTMDLRSHEIDVRAESGTQSHPLRPATHHG
jgi:hypothetical protein